MDFITLFSICKDHKLEIQTDISGYGRSVNVFLDNKKISNENKDYSELIDWSYNVLHGKIMDDFENLDSFICNIVCRGDDLYFEFEFDNSWKYDGLYEGDKITPQDILPYLPDFIKQFKEYNSLELDEDYVFCSFTYNQSWDNTISIDIHDLWSEGDVNQSFISNLELIERLKVEILRSVEKTFSEYQQLWVCSEDGIDISILSTYKQIYSYDELF